MYPTWLLRSFEGPWRGFSLTVSGGHGEGETPLPIPNRAVKPLSADGTWPARARESRTPPVLQARRAAPRAARFVVVRPSQALPARIRAGRLRALRAPRGSARRRRPHVAAPQAGPRLGRDRCDAVLGTGRAGPSASRAGWSAQRD